jgi:tRNA threonylcarbamoyl adenosine modification protein (Sua5/YciO/YrdC/YwlC family)
MIEYVVEHNPDDRILARASQILQNGGLLCFPTETNWVVVCDPFQKQSVDRLYRLRHIENTKHLTVLCSNFQRAMEIAFIDDGAFRLIKKVTPGPYTFIFEAQKKITKFLKASKIDHQVGLHFPPVNLCNSILEACGGLLLSSHVSHDMIPDADPDLPLYSALIEDALGHQIELIIDPGEYEFIGPTSMIDFTSGIPEVLREGSGDISLFK